MENEVTIARGKRGREFRDFGCGFPTVNCSNSVVSCLLRGVARGGLERGSFE